MPGYAYKDKGGVIHIAPEKYIAEEKAVGPILDYPHEHYGGYPIFNGKLLRIDVERKIIKYDGRTQNITSWPAGSGHVRQALRELWRG